MSHKRLSIAAAIIFCIILAVFAISLPRSTKAPEEPVSESVATSTPTVAISDSFKKGLHTITGSIDAPDVCSVVEAAATLLGEASSTQSILLDVSMQENSGICLQRKATIRFQATVTAPARVPIVVKVNGVSATTTNL